MPRVRKLALNHTALPYLDRHLLIYVYMGRSLTLFIPVQVTPLYHFLKFIRPCARARLAIMSVKFYYFT